MRCVMATSSETDGGSGYAIGSNTRWVDWKTTDHPCMLCDKVFLSDESLGSHMRNHHRVGASSVGRGSKIEDSGFSSMVSGVAQLWKEFRDEHQLPPMVPMFGDIAVRLRSEPLLSRGTIMPMFYSGRFEKPDGTRIDSVVFPNSWLSLDVDAKCASLAHTAAHVENRLCGVTDVSFFGKGWHNKAFMRTASTYDLYVSNSPGFGYARTFVNDEFRKRHCRAMRLISRYVPLVDVGGSKDVPCGI